MNSRRLILIAPSRDPSLMISHDSTEATGRGSRQGARSTSAATVRVFCSYPTGRRAAGPARALGTADGSDRQTAGARGWRGRLAGQARASGMARQCVGSDRGPGHRAATTVRSGAAMRLRGPYAMTMSDDWCGLGWTQWAPLQRQAILQVAPTLPGVYRIRHQGGEPNRLVYVGQTGRSLRERLISLAAGVEVRYGINLKTAKALGLEVPGRCFSPAPTR